MAAVSITWWAMFPPALSPAMKQRLRSTFWDASVHFQVDSAKAFIPFGGEANPLSAIPIEKHGKRKKKVVSTLTKGSTDENKKSRRLSQNTSTTTPERPKRKATSDVPSTLVLVTQDNELIKHFSRKKKTKIVDAFENEKTSKSQKISTSMKEYDNTKKINALDLQDTAASDSKIPENEKSIEIPTETVGLDQTSIEGIAQVDTALTLFLPNTVVMNVNIELVEDKSFDLGHRIADMDPDTPKFRPVRKVYIILFQPLKLFLLKVERENKDDDSTCKVEIREDMERMTLGFFILEELDRLSKAWKEITPTVSSEKR
ncbi:hypothetical protein RHMOL_Rhmol11G0073200 [Rhododendron molle]|uniref:Uncharacterized protein n=1 Tax=Rhododendron molle TaxID=49168 RepID=A0ACC0LPP3_RHOML|nr:hypothetical protein RHMOL_Rhmol11G0073200 [Rhododendron molle]